MQARRSHFRRVCAHLTDRRTVVAGVAETCDVLPASSVRNRCEVQFVAVSGERLVRVARNGAAAVVCCPGLAPRGCASSIMDGIWGDSSTSSTAAAGARRRPVARHDSRRPRMPRSAKLYNEGLESLNDGQTRRRSRNSPKSSASIPIRASPPRPS